MGIWRLIWVPPMVTTRQLDDEDAHNGSGTREGLHVGSPGVNSAGAKRQDQFMSQKRRANWTTVKITRKMIGAAALPLMAMLEVMPAVIGTAISQNRASPNTTERAHCGDADGADRGDVQPCSLEQKAIPESDRNR